MDIDDLKRTKKILFVVGFIANLLVAILCILSIGYTSEFAGALIKMGNRIAIIFIGIGFTAVFCLVVRLMCKYWNMGIVFTLSIVLVGVMCIGYYNICMSIINPKSLITNEEVRAHQLKKLDGLIKKGNKMLAKSENIMTDQTIRTEDSLAIINYFNHFLDSTFYRYPDTLILEYSSTFHHFFNRGLIERPYGRIKMDSVNINKYRQIIKNKLSIDLFSYSPDKRKLFIIMTYEVGEEPTGANALAMIGQRDNNQLILYRYQQGFRNDYSVVNKQYALYQIIADFKGNSNTRQKTHRKENPLKKSFWEGGWFEKISINNTEKYRYQLNDTYKWNEQKQYNERITAEVEHFIEIKK
jgi:hypothetical protein